MFNAKPCPNCGNLLPIYNAPNAFLAGGFFTTELLLWLGVMLLATWLWSPAGSGGFFAGLGALAMTGWLLSRRDQRKERQTEAGRGWYICPRCHHQYEDDGQPLSSH